MTTVAPRRDAFPEETAYRDTGCELHPRCLSCPRALCVYDEPEHPKTTRQRLRREHAAALGREGLTVKQIAQAMGISYRQAIRLKQGPIQHPAPRYRTVPQPPRGTPPPSQGPPSPPADRLAPRPRPSRLAAAAPPRPPAPQ